LFVGTRVLISRSTLFYNSGTDGREQLYMKIAASGHV